MWLLASALVIQIYVEAYYRTTTLRVDTPDLDWYAYREFSSDAHMWLFVPMYHWEARRARFDPGYALLAKVKKRR